MSGPIDPAMVAEFAVWFVVFLFSLTLHEGAHALLARLGGDDTAYLGGQVSLNPLPHIRREFFGTIIVPIASFFLAGWMMGWASTPYDPFWAQKHPRRAALMSLAGPCANLLIAIIAFLVLRVMFRAGFFIRTDEEVWSISRIVDPAPSYGDDSLLWPAGTALSIALALNLLLFIFNLLPLPPMDGSGVLQGLFPRTIGRFIEMLQGNTMLSLLGLVLAWNLLPWLFWPVFLILRAMIYAPV